ncbi:hypothetical protein C8R45DRAFT_1183459 [Mycena sanguinolenta]|nr:hypothetical protein C8R45DRAFT_1183459 [Mycena sanguinolenta]
MSGAALGWRIEAVETDGANFPTRRQQHERTPPHRPPRRDTRLRGHTRTRACCRGRRTRYPRASRQAHRRRCPRALNDDEHQVEHVRAVDGEIPILHPPASFEHLYRPSCARVRSWKRIQRQARRRAHPGGAGTWCYSSLLLPLPPCLVLHAFTVFHPARSRGRTGGRATPLSPPTHSASLSLQAAPSSSQSCATASTSIPRASAGRRRIAIVFFPSTAVFPCALTVATARRGTVDSGSRGM